MPCTCHAPAIAPAMHLLCTCYGCPCHALAMHLPCTRHAPAKHAPGHATATHLPSMHLTSSAGLAGGKHRAHQHLHASRPPSVLGAGELVGSGGLLACRQRETSVLVLEPVEMPRLDPTLQPYGAEPATVCDRGCNPMYQVGLLRLDPTLALSLTSPVSGGAVTPRPHATRQPPLYRGARAAQHSRVHRRRSPPQVHDAATSP